MMKATYREALPAVLAALESAGHLPAEKKKVSGTEIRYRSKGSLCVNTEKAGFYDHESGIGGGLLKLVAYAAGTTEPGKWLRDRGIRVGDETMFRRFPRFRQMPKQKPRDTSAEDEAKMERAVALLEASAPVPLPEMTDEEEREAIRNEGGRPVSAAPGHPCQAWRDSLLEASGVVETLRWLDRKTLNGIKGVVTVPPEAAGALLYPKASLDSWMCGEPIATAVELEYVSEDGGPVADSDGQRKRTYGCGKGKVWSTGSCGTGPIHLAEGGADALAVALNLEHGQDCLAAGGAGGMPAAARLVADAGQDLVLNLDDDPPGVRAGRKAACEFRKHAPRYASLRVVVWTPDPDGQRRMGGIRQASPGAAGSLPERRSPS